MTWKLWIESDGKKAPYYDCSCGQTYHGFYHVVCPGCGLYPKMIPPSIANLLANPEAANIPYYAPAGTTATNYPQAMTQTQSVIYETPLETNPSDWQITPQKLSEEGPPLPPAGSEVNGAILIELQMLNEKFKELLDVLDNRWK